MNNKELLIKALNTLFWSFGSDAPPEVIWGVNELLEWIEHEFNVKFENQFSEGSSIEDDFERIIKQIESF